MDTSADPPIGGKGKAKAKASSSAGGGDPAKAQHLPWVEKYRPAGLNDLVAHEDIVRTIRTLISKDQLPHLLLHGPPGTGKTSTILAAAKEMYGPQYGSMTLELNASDDRGIDVRALRCAARAALHPSHPPPRRWCASKSRSSPGPSGSSPRASSSSYLTRQTP